VQKKMILGGLGATLVIASLMSKAEAFPPFKAKEGVADCRYCHMTAQGGKRNYRGVFYKANNSTFAGFDDVAEAKKAGVEVAEFADSKPKSLTPPAKPVGAPPKPAGESAATKTAKAKLAAAEANAKAKPKDAKAKLALASAHTALGKAVMGDAGLLPKAKYPWALKEFDAALKLNPKDAEAAKFKKAINDVYAGMKK
jgi:hypothetical protein